MANVTIYTMLDGTDIPLKLTADGIVKLEEKLGESIAKKMTELDKLSVAAEYVAAACEKDGRKTALAIYDDIIEREQTIEEYHKLIYKILVSAGFLKAAKVEQQIELTAATEKMQDLAYTLQQKEIAKKTKELEATETPNISE